MGGHGAGWGSRLGLGGWAPGVHVCGVRRAGPVTAGPVTAGIVTSHHHKQLQPAQAVFISLVTALRRTAQPASVRDVRFVRRGGGGGVEPGASLLCASLPCASLPCVSLPCASLPCASLPCASLPCASLPCASLPCASLPCASLPCASLPCASLPCASLPCASLPCASLPCASLQAALGPSLLETPRRASLIALTALTALMALMALTALTAQTAGPRAAAHTAQAASSADGCDDTRGRRHWRGPCAGRGRRGLWQARAGTSRSQRQPRASCHTAASSSPANPERSTCPAPRCHPRATRGRARHAARWLGRARRSAAWTAHGPQHGHERSTCPAGPHPPAPSRMTRARASR
jgi:hypothetical protein